MNADMHVTLGDIFSGERHAEVPPCPVNNTPKSCGCQSGRDGPSWEAVTEKAVGKGVADSRKKKKSVLLLGNRKSFQQLPDLIRHPHGSPACLEPSAVARHHQVPPPRPQLLLLGSPCRAPPACSPELDLKPLPRVSQPLTEFLTSLSLMIDLLPSRTIHFHVQRTEGWTPGLATHADHQTLCPSPVVLT